MAKNYPKLPFPMDNKLDECVNANLTFDEIAEVTITLYADLAHEKKAKPALEKVARVCGTFLKTDGITAAEAAEKQVGWDGLYNMRVEDILSEVGGAKQVDRWGAFGWTDPTGERHFGDENSFFPLYPSEAKLRADLAKQFIKKNPLLQKRFLKTMERADPL